MSAVAKETCCDSINEQHIYHDRYAKVISPSNRIQFPNNEVYYPPQKYNIPYLEMRV